MDRLKDKVVLVTRGSLGIGRAGCKRIAQEGGHVAITDVNDEKGKELEKEMPLKEL